MKKIWIRLGAEITVNDEEFDAVMNGDEDILIKAIKNRGAQLDGESYIPENDMEFSINPSKDTLLK